MNDRTDLETLGVSLIDAGLMHGRVGHLCFHAMQAEVADEDCEDLDAATGLFFLHQSMIAAEHLTEVQHCHYDTIAYLGVFHGKHVWMARS